MLALSLLLAGLVSAQVRESAPRARVRVRTGPVQRIAAPTSALGGVSLKPRLAAPVPVPDARLKPAAGLPQPGPARPETARPSAAGQTAEPGGEEPRAEPQRSVEAESAAAARRFDDPSRWRRLVRALRPDRVPEFPGKTGDTLRVNGRSYVLGERLGDGSGGVVYKVWGQDKAVKLIAPDHKGDPLFGREAEALELLRGTAISHARLIDSTPDQLAIVRDYVEGETLGEVLKKGPLDDKQKNALMHLSAQLLAAGLSADISNGNLVWEKFWNRWSLIDAGGVVHDETMGPIVVLNRMIHSDRGIDDPVGFLRGLRGRLGPDSVVWARVEKAASLKPRLAAALRGLEALDSALPKAPALVFEAAPFDPAYSDEAVSHAELRKRAGFDPQTEKPRYVVKVKGGVEVFRFDRGKYLKVTSDLVVSRELALRRFARRFFGRYFKTPASLGVLNGWSSYLLMEEMDAFRSYSTPLDLEGSVAIGLFARTFGLEDLSPENRLVGRRGETVLLDFEQSFGRSHPVLSRLPIDSLFDEMPWVNRRRANAIEDFLPAIAAWRKVFHANRKAIEDDLRRSGFPKKEIPGLMEVLRGNVARLEWTLQADVDFANSYPLSPREASSP